MTEKSAFHFIIWSIYHVICNYCFMAFIWNNRHYRRLQPLFFISRHLSPLNRLDWNLCKWNPSQLLPLRRIQICSSELQDGWPLIPFYFYCFLGIHHALWILHNTRIWSLIPVLLQSVFIKELLIPTERQKKGAKSLSFSLIAIN